MGMLVLQRTVKQKCKKVQNTRQNYRKGKTFFRNYNFINIKIGLFVEKLAIFAEPDKRALRR